MAHTLDPRFLKFCEEATITVLKETDGNFSYCTGGEYIAFLHGIYAIGGTHEQAVKALQTHYHVEGEVNPNV